jgi:hypothetical protein
LLHDRHVCFGEARGAEQLSIARRRSHCRLSFLRAAVAERMQSVCKAQGMNEWWMRRHGVGVLFTNVDRGD